GLRDVDDRARGVAELDVEARALGLEDVVVEADAIERDLAVRVVDPVDVLLPLLVEAEVEDEDLVPRERARVVGDARGCDEARERRGGDETLERDLALRRSRDPLRD